MNRDKIKEGDICTLDESVAYSYNPHKPYEVVVLWHGVNSQPLVTKLDAYKPFWTTYSQLIEVNRHIDLSIKVLEQQTCEDAVSREAVLDIFANNADAVRPYSKTWEEVKDLPSVNPQPKTGWIPVSERLPEDIKPVIVTWKNTDPKSYYQYIVGKHFIGTAHYKNGKWFWYSSVTEDLLAEYGRCDSEEFDEAIEVIAWMPLPEPYEPQESEG